MDLSPSFTSDSLSAGDLVSMYLGAIKTPYGKFLLGSLLGAAPAVIAETWIGTSVQEQNWEMLAWSIGASLGVAIISTVCYTIYQKKPETSMHLLLV